MTIEIRQMQIKSTVLKDSSTANNSRDSSFDLEEIKETILGECKRLLIEMFRERQER